MQGGYFLYFLHFFLGKRIMFSNFAAYSPSGDSLKILRYEKNRTFGSLPAFLLDFL